MDSPLSPGVVARGIKKGRPPGTANGFDLGRKIGSLNRDGKASKAERKEQKRQCAIKRRNALLRLKHKELVAENDQLKKRHKPDINDCCQVLLATQEGTTTDKLTSAVMHIAKYAHINLEGRRASTFETKGLGLLHDSLAAPLKPYITKETTRALREKFSPIRCLVLMDQLGGVINGQSFKWIRKLLDGEKGERLILYDKSAIFDVGLDMVEGAIAMGIRFELFDNGRGGRLNPQDVLYWLNKRFGTEKEFTSAFVMDGAKLTEYLPMYLSALKIVNHTSFIDAATGESKAVGKCCQSREDNILLTFALGKDDNASIERNDGDTIRCFEEINREGFTDDRMNGGKRAWTIAFTQDEKAKNASVNKGGSSATASRPCHQCAVGQHDMASSAPTKCDFCKECHAADFECPHHDVLDSQFIEKAKNAAPLLLATVIAWPTSKTPIAERRAFYHRLNSRADVAVLDSDALNREIKHYKANVFIENCHVVDIAQEDQVDKNLALRGMTTQNIHEFKSLFNFDPAEKRVRAQFEDESDDLFSKRCLLFGVISLSNKVGHATTVNDEDNYTIITMTELLVPCVLHAQMRTSEKLLTSNVQRMLDMCNSEKSRSHLVGIVERFINTVLSNQKDAESSERSTSSFRVTTTDNGKRVETIAMNLDRMMKVQARLSELFGWILKDGVLSKSLIEKDKAKGQQAAVIVQQVQDTLVAMQQEFVEFNAIFDSIRTENDMTNAEIDEWQVRVDLLMVKLLATHGRHIVTTYFHSLRAGHFRYYLKKFKNIFRFANIGFEACNGLIRGFVLRRTQRGGYNRSGSNTPIARSVVHLMVRKFIIFLAGSGDFMGVDLNFIQEVVDKGHKIRLEKKRARALLMKQDSLAAAFVDEEEEEQERAIFEELLQEQEEEDDDTF